MLMTVSDRVYSQQPTVDHVANLYELTGAICYNYVECWTAYSPKSPMRGALKIIVPIN